MLVPAGCAVSDDRSSALVDLELPRAAAVISTESGLLAAPSGIAVDGRGRIWIADFTAKHLVSTDADGNNPLIVGREGQGPGEFRGPLAVVAIPGGIRVADAFNNRLQDYRPDGTHIADHAPGIRALGGAAMAPDGRFVVPVFGDDSALASFHRLGEPRAVRFGVPPVHSVAQRTPAEQWSDVGNHTIPQEMRNFHFPAIGDSALYLAMMSDVEVRQYDETGHLRWATALDVPEVRAIRDAYFASRSDTSSGPPQPLMALTQVSEVGEAVWVLLNVDVSAGAGAALYILDRQTGRIAGRLKVHLPERALKFAVDGARARLYLTVPDQAAVYATDIAAVPPHLR